MTQTYYTDLTEDTATEHTINTPGTHVYFLHNRSGDLSFTIAHSRATLHVFALYEGSGREHFTLNTVQKHTVPGAASFITIKGVFRDRARFDFSGVIALDKKAQKTEAVLENRNLLLSDRARVTTRPALEIYPDDVICTHAATVAQIDPEQIHYLETRGIPRDSAHEMLVQGFVDDLHQKRDALR